MKCPFCSYEEQKVIDSRPVEESNSIRRRRECLKCLKRFTTYEKVESLSVMVVKKDKTREEFDRDKLLSGLVRACQKRPVSITQLESLVSEIETQLSAIAKEVPETMLETYKTKRKERIFPVVGELTSNRCPFCSMEPPLAARNKLTGGATIECDNCHRLIFSK